MEPRKSLFCTEMLTFKKELTHVQRCFTAVESAISVILGNKKK